MGQSLNGDRCTAPSLSRSSSDDCTVMLNLTCTHLNTGSWRKSMRGSKLSGPPGSREQTALDVGLELLLAQTVVQLLLLQLLLGCMGNDKEEYSVTISLVSNSNLMKTNARSVYFQRHQTPKLVNLWCRQNFDTYSEQCIYKCNIRMSMFVMFVISVSNNGKCFWSC